MRLIIVAACLFFQSALLFAIDPAEFPDNDKTGSSVAPIVGYEPVYKFVFGGGYFYDAKHLSLGVDFNLNFKKVYQGHIKLTQAIDDKWFYHTELAYIRGFDPFYGDGGETKVEDFRRIWGTRTTARIELDRQWLPMFSAGFFADVRVRTEDRDEDEPFVRYFPNETRAAFGLTGTLDKRDNKKDPKEGFLFTADMTYSFAGFSSLEHEKDFLQFEGLFTVYKEILRDFIPDVIAAYRLMGGYTFGTPSYMYKFRLGGSDMLTGYFDNRFRGKEYYLQQTEIRFPIWKLFSGAMQLGFGDASDTNFTNPKMSYGLGIRIGLPPNYISKIRIDYAWGKDQSGFFADFGQTF